MCFPVSEGKPALLERIQLFYGSCLLKFSCYKMYSSPRNSSEQIFFVYNLTTMRIILKSAHNVHNILIAVHFKITEKLRRHKMLEIHFSHSI